MFALLLAVLAASPSQLPLLTQHTHRGMVANPENQLIEYCSVFSDRVEMTLENYDGVLSVVTRPINLTADIATLARQAAEGPIVHEQHPTDGPATERFATVLQDDVVRLIDLGKKVSGDRTHNDNPAASVLRRILVQTCPAPEHDE